VAFVLIMFGFLLQWPTVLTLVMFPILVVMYLRLALAEERESAAVFGDPWERYARRTPRFVPKLGATMPQDCGKASAKPHGHTVEKGPGIESPSATALPCAGGAAAPGPSPDSAKGQPHNHGTLNMNP
jgi:hypothetical protein